MKNISISRIVIRRCSYFIEECMDELRGIKGPQIIHALADPDIADRDIELVHDSHESCTPRSGTNQAAALAACRVESSPMKLPPRPTFSSTSVSQSASCTGIPSWDLRHMRKISA